MAISTNLPIYKVAYDLLNVVTELVKHMPRDFKSSIGSKISAECVEIVVLIFRANCLRRHLDKLQAEGQVDRHEPAQRGQGFFLTWTRRENAKSEPTSAALSREVGSTDGL